MKFFRRARDVWRVNDYAHELSMKMFRDFDQEDDPADIRFVITAERDENGNLRIQCVKQRTTEDHDD